MQMEYFERAVAGAFQFHRSLSNTMSKQNWGKKQITSSVVSKYQFKFIFHMNYITPFTNELHRVR